MTDRGTALPTPKVWYSLPADTQIRLTEQIDALAPDRPEEMIRISRRRFDELREIERDALDFRDRLLDSEGLRWKLEGLER